MNATPVSPADWERIAPFFDRALDLSGNELDAWMTELTTTQPEIAAAVRALLAKHAELAASSFLEHPPVSAARALSLTGRTVGGYTIEELIGRGGMGEVWRARRSDGRFEGQCAIKFLDEALVSPKLVDRFRREGALLARLTHPNIARLLDAGTLEGRAYLVLEYVDGERIDQYCARQPLEARVRLFMDVVAAVAHAHSQLVVHRDLKPSNVLVTREGQVKLLDFGIAKLLSADPGADDLTRIEDAALTPEYAAPEQLLGDPPSTATDVYQLGMLLYVLLVGKHPRQGTGTRAEKIRAALEGTIPRASEFAGPSLSNKLRGDLDAIMAVALRKDPAERFSTAQAFRDELQRYLSHEPVLARRGAALYRVRRFVARHRAGVALSALAVVSLVGALVFAFVQMREAQLQRDQVRLEANRATAEASFMNLMMAELGSPDEPVTPDIVLGKGLDLLEKNFSNDPPFVVDMLIRMSGRFLDMGNHNRELDALVRAEKLARKTGDDLMLARVQCYTVETEISLGHLEQAASRLSEGLALQSRVAEIPLNDQLICLRARADMSRGEGKPQETMRLLTQLLQMYEQNGMTLHVDYMPAVDQLATLYLHQGDIKTAYELQRKIRVAAEQSGGGGTMGAAAALHNESLALWNLGELRAAFEGETRVIKIHESQGPDVSLPLGLSIVYASMLARLEHDDEAQKRFDRALLDAKDNGDEWSKINLRISRARFMVAAQRFGEAAAELKAADALARGSEIDVSLLIMRADVVRVGLLLQAGKVDEARRLMEAALPQAADPAGGAGMLHPQILLALSQIATAEGKYAEATTHAKAALDIFTKRARDPAQSADVGEAALQMAKVRKLSGDPQAARDFAARAANSFKNAVGEGHSLMRATLALQAELASGA
jgi:eukaryotic-like serine/threonine-protein kinase